MSAHAIGSFGLDLNDLDVSVFPIGSRLQDSEGFDEALSGFIERVFQSWDGFAELSKRPGTPEVQVRYSLRQDLETVRDKIIWNLHVDAVSDYEHTHATQYEQLEVLRFILSDDPDVHRVLAELALARRDFDRALKLVDIALSRGKKDQRLLLLQGRARLGFGRMDAARESFELAYELDDRCVEAGIGLTRIMLWEGRQTTELEKLLLRIVEQAPQHSQALFTLSMVRLSQGRIDAGESMLRSVVRNEESPPIGEYAWKAWVELNRRFSKRLHLEQSFINLIRLRERARKHFSPLSTMSARDLRSLAWGLFKQDFHSVHKKNLNRTFHVRELSGDVRIDDVISILWVVFSILAPERGNRSTNPGSVIGLSAVLFPQEEQQHDNSGTDRILD